MFQIPNRLELILRDSEFFGPLLATTQIFETWINNSLTPFFPNYTKHDIKHIEDVLSSCDDLVHEDALAVLTPADVTVLIVGCLLHDSALHLTEEGFLQLISDKSPWNPILPFDKVRWSDAWTSFLGDARRFDGKKLTQLTGSPEPITIPPRDVANWTERHKKLIGEFIRRHHTALAHQFAVTGLPGTSAKPLPLLVGLREPIPDLAGIVARSHGHNLRAVIPYLEAHYHAQDFQGIHAVYLMSLLRIADYLQLQSNRAPGEILELRDLRSPISDAEWRVHRATFNITRAVDDPEAVYVDNRPSNVSDYIRVRDWLSDSGWLD